MSEAVARGGSDGGSGDGRTPGIRILGAVDVEGAGPGVSGTKQRLVLAVLALRPGRRARSDELVDVLWPEGGPKDPQRSLQVHVSNLRSVLDAAGIEGSIDHDGYGYVLRVSPTQVDAHRFADLAERGIALVESAPDRARSVLDAALDLWRGDPLGGLDDHPVLRSEVRGLQELRVRAREARVEADMATGRVEAAVVALQRLTTEHPLRERLWAQLMRALFRGGRQGEALATFEEARRVLAEELGVDPGGELRSVHEQILQRDPRLQDGGSDRAAADGTPGAPAEEGSIAVLPFEVLGEDRDAELLALGLHNDLLTELSRVGQLTVISRTSMLSYAGTQRSIPAIARELDVATVVEGTVQTVGTRLRLTVQMIDGARDAHTWAKYYDRELTTETLFTIQTELARAIVAELLEELLPRPSAPTGSGPRTASLDAYRLVAAARQQLDLKTADGFVQAGRLYEEATRVDPTYVDAWVGLAEALAAREAYGHGERYHLLPRAEQAVHRALGLDPESPAAHTALAVLHLTYQDGPAAIRELEQAIELRSSLADAHRWLTWLLLLTGDAAGARRSALRTLELDPVSAEPHAHMALAAAANNDPVTGIEAARRAKRFSPYTTADFYEGLCLHEAGRHAEARDVLAELHAADEPVAPWAGRGPDAVRVLALAAMGDQDEAHAVAATIDTDEAPFAAGLAALGLGEVDRAVACFDGVERLSAWPALAIHHHHRAVWTPIVGHEAWQRLRRALRRSWRLPAEGAPAPETP